MWELRRPGVHGRYRQGYETIKCIWGVVGVMEVLGRNGGREGLWRGGPGREARKWGPTFMKTRHGVSGDRELVLGCRADGGGGRGFGEEIVFVGGLIMGVAEYGCRTSWWAEVKGWATARWMVDTALVMAMVEGTWVRESRGSMVARG
jgi:hypothetical protein